MDLDTVIQKAKENDSGAFDTLYRTYYPKMIGTCMKIVKNDDAAQDLVHDAFILAFSSLNKLRDNERFGEWLTTIVRNVSLKYVEQRDSNQTITIESAGLENEMTYSSTNTESEVNYKLLLELVSQLPEGYRNIFRMSVIEGFSHNEIAQILGIGPHTSSSQLSRAKQFLKKLMNGMHLVLLILLIIPLIWYLTVRHHSEHFQPDSVTEHTASVTNDEFQQAVQTNIVQTERNLPNPPISDNDDVGRHSSVRRVNQNQIKTERPELNDSSDSIGGHSEYVTNEDYKSEEDGTKNEDDLPSDTDVKENETPILTNRHDLENKKSSKYHILASGAIGQSLNREFMHLVANSESTNPTNPRPHHGEVFPLDIRNTIPSEITNWSDYWNYLYFYEFEDSPTSAKVTSLMEIAGHNNGIITEKVKYDQPVTFGLSFARMLNQKLCIETGLQYSILGTQHIIGDNGYSIINKGTIHYLGLPLRLSHTFEENKRLSSYWSAGLTMHIPVYSKSNSACVVNWKEAYSESGSIEPDIQWQTQISLGLQYRVAPKASLFVEPSLSRFLKSDSEVRTVWNEQPFMCTIPFGIRIFW